MKIRLLSPALRRVYGETCDSKDMAAGKAEHLVRIGMAQKLSAPKKSTAESKGAKKAETTEKERA